MANKKETFKNDLFNSSILFLLDRLVGITADINKLLAKIYIERWYLFQLAWFDHRFDYAQGPQNYYWMERAICAMREIKKNYKILDIGCGDGMFDGYFYSKFSKRVDAIDIDSKAIAFAKNKYLRKNIYYHNTGAISWLMNKKKYNLIIMFVVIYHFDAETGQKVLKMIKRSLSKNGVLLGSTPIFESRSSYNSEHKNIFLSERQVKGFFAKVFDKVEIFTSDWPDGRKECYFKCSI